MALKVSKADLSKGYQRAESLKNRLANVRKRTEKIAERAVHSTEVATAAFAAGVIQGKTGGIEIVGVPLELGLGLGLNLAGYMGLGGKASNHLQGFGDGFLAAYLTTLGRGVGMKWKEKAGGGTGILETPRSVRGIGKGADAFTDSELARSVIDVPVPA